MLSLKTPRAQAGVRGGEIGIRTREGVLAPYPLSRRALSTTQPSLRGSRYGTRPGGCYGILRTDGGCGKALEYELTGARLFALSFVLCGIIVLLAHPRSRPVLSYAFKADRVRPVLAANPLSNEPFEFFPPDASEMDTRRRFMAAFRIVRRLGSEWVAPDDLDLQIVHTFFSKAAALDPENAYWAELDAAVYGYEGNPAQGLKAWLDASRRGRWETGEAVALAQLWEDLARADDTRLSWQGVVALDHASGGPTKFIAKSTEIFMKLDIRARYATLLNASVILDSARSFSMASSAITMANQAVFNSDDPIDALGQRRYEEIKAEFPNQVKEALGQAAAERAASAEQNVESWQTFYRGGRPMAEAQMRRLKVESLLTASLPSSLFMSALILAVVGLSGLAVATLFGPVLNPDRRILFGVGVVVGIGVYAVTGAALLFLWAVTLAAVLCIPQPVARDEAIEWRRLDRVSMVCLSTFGLLCFTLHFLLDSTPATYLIPAKLQASPFGWIGAVALSLSMPAAWVWARSRRISVLRAAGETLRLVGFAGAFIGLAATIVTTPLALWRDAANRDYVENWIRNEPAAFRPDSPQ